MSLLCFLLLSLCAFFLFCFFCFFLCVQVECGQAVFTSWRVVCAVATPCMLAVRRAGIAQWLERRTRDRKQSWVRVFPLERLENVLLQGQLSVLTLISVSVPPQFTAVARARSRSLCQNCR